MDENTMVAGAVALKKMQEMKEMMPMMADYTKFQAQIAYQRYTAFINAGFSEEKAMQLCTKNIEMM